MVFAYEDIVIIMAGVAILATAIIYAGRRVADEFFFLNEQVKKGAVGSSEKRRDDEYQKKLEDLKKQFPEKFPGLVSTDPTQKT